MFTSSHPTLRTIAAAGVLAAVSAIPASAAMVVETFDDPVVLSATSGPGVWYKDRYAPAGFQSVEFGGDSRLELTLAAADGGQANAFYNTQGRKLQTPGATYAYIDFYVDPAFELAAGRIGGLWASAVDGLGDGAGWPIIEFADGGFQYWNSEDPGGWTQVQTEFAYGDWVNMGFEIDGEEIAYFLNGQEVGRVGALGAASFADVIIQGYNHNSVDRSMYFDNLTYDAASASPVPLPGALPLMGMALGGLALARRRRAASAA